MGKYVAVGVLAVIVLAAVTYEAPKGDAFGAKPTTTEAQGAHDGARVEGAFGALPPPPPVREAPVTTPAPVPSSAPTIAPPAPAGPGTSGTTTATTLPVSSPRQDPLTYTLKAGQTLCDAAQELLGDRNRWREVYEANKDRIPDPNRVRAGLKLIFTPGPTTRTASAPRAGSGMPCPISPPPGGKSVTVAKGDTLYSIARRELGDGKRWREIKALNQLRSDTLVTGTVLIMPAR